MCKMARDWPACGLTKAYLLTTLHISPRNFVNLTAVKSQTMESYPLSCRWLFVKFPKFSRYLALQVTIRYRPGCIYKVRYIWPPHVCMYANLSWYSIPFKRNRKSRVYLHLKTLIGSCFRLTDLSTQQTSKQVLEKLLG